jgi:drug/metabolite transporter (DMT)-like permease
LTAYRLALGSAALYGAADFLGGLASRRASTLVVVVIAQAAGLLPLTLLLPLFPGSPSREDLLWGAVAGLAGSVGVGLLYRALAIGTMSIVAPTTAVCAVVVPVVVDAVGGQRLPVVTQIGIGLALVAIVLVSQHDDALACANRPGDPLLLHATAEGPVPRRSRAVESTLPPGLALALVSGIAVGLFFIALARTSAAAGVWPLLVSRSVSVVLFSAVALARSRSIRIPGAVLRVAITCGVIDMLANALYLFATRGGPLSIVVTLASLYPASTVLLARVVVGERLTRRQASGVVCALVAVVLIVGDWN